MPQWGQLLMLLATDVYHDAILQLNCKHQVPFESTAGRPLLLLPTNRDGRKITRTSHRPTPETPYTCRVSIRPQLHPSPRCITVHSVQTYFCDMEFQYQHPIESVTATSYYNKGFDSNEDNESVPKGNNNTTDPKKPDEATNLQVSCCWINKPADSVSIDDAEHAVPFRKLFRFASLADIGLLVVGGLCALLNGLCLPAILTLFGDLMSVIMTTSAATRMNQTELIVPNSTTGDLQNLENVSPQHW